MTAELGYSIPDLGPPWGPGLPDFSVTASCLEFLPFPYPPLSRLISLGRSGTSWGLCG